MCCSHTKVQTMQKVWAAWGNFKGYYFSILPKQFGGILENSWEMFSGMVKKKPTSLHFFYSARYFRADYLGWKSFISAKKKIWGLEKEHRCSKRFSRLFFPGCLKKLQARIFNLPGNIIKIEFFSFLPKNWGHSRRFQMIKKLLGTFLLLPKENLRHCIQMVEESYHFCCPNIFLCKSWC
jgi:hypothetical protein